MVCFVVRIGYKTVLGSTHVVEQLSFSLIPSILTFDFDLVFEPFFTFGAQIFYFWGQGLIQILI